MTAPSRRACIDVGSNSVLLLAAEWTDSDWRMICDESIVTGLGEGVKQTGMLKPEAMARTLEAVRSFFIRAKDLGAGVPDAYATMAARLAKNQAEFLAAAEAQGTPIQVLSGDDEARLGFDSVANDPLFSAQKVLAIVDPGGQSTELAIAHRSDAGWQTVFSHSFPVGTLGLRSGPLIEPSPEPEAWFQAMMQIDRALEAVPLPPAAFQDSEGIAVVLGASGTNLISIRDKVVPWDPAKVHGASLTFGEISLMLKSLGALSDEGRARLEGIEPGRERTIHIGALIIERFLFHIGAKGCVVSVRGWRYALLEERARIGLGDTHSQRGAH